MLWVNVVSCIGLEVPLTAAASTLPSPASCRPDQPLSKTEAGQTTTPKPAVAAPIKDGEKNEDFGVQEL